MPQHGARRTQRHLFRKASVSVYMYRCSILDMYIYIYIFYIYIYWGPPRRRLPLLALESLHLGAAPVFKALEAETSPAIWVVVKTMVPFWVP